MAANVVQTTTSAAETKQQANPRTDNPRKTTTSTTDGNNDGPSSSSSSASSDVIVVYDVEHLATFSTAAPATAGSHETNNARSNDDSKSKHTASCKDDPVATTGLVAKAPLAARGKASAAAAASVQSFADGGITTPRVALRRLFELEKLSGIWTQRMQIELRTDEMLIVDCETNSIVERFSKSSVTKPEAFNEYNHIYNNIVVFIIKSSSSSPPSTTATPSEANNAEGEEEEGELHIFQCCSQQAQQLVQDILDWKVSKLAAKSTTANLVRSEHEMISNSSLASQQRRQQPDSATADKPKKQQQQDPSPSPPKKQQASKPVVVTVASSSGANENVPVVNVNVKETVQAFNQIAALREKSKPASPTSNGTAPAAPSQQQRPLSDASAVSSTSATNKQEDQVGASFFKQRSIRAKLSGATGDQVAATNNKSRSTNSSSTATASVTSSASSSASASSSSVDQLKQQAAPTVEPAKTTNSSGSTSNASNPSGGFHHHHNSNNNHQSSTSNSSQLQQQQQQQTHSSTASKQHPTKTSNNHAQANNNTPSSSSTSSASSSAAATKTNGKSTQQPARTSASHLDQVTTNESYVSVLNHCFDDIEKFILRLQQSMAAARELQQAKRKLSKRSSAAHQVEPAGGGAPLSASEMALLSARARGPGEEDYFEILSKFKLAFNLLAKLKGCIHEPNAPELVHFLFTPLAIIIESARNAKPAIDPTLVGIPYLNQDALDLLSNCCTSKEYDMWMSLGPNWIQTIDSNLLKASRLPSSFQPIFSDGWAPIIGELELIGLVVDNNSTRRSSSHLLAEEPPLVESERQHRHRHKHQQHHRPRHPSAGAPSSYPSSMSPPPAPQQKSSRSRHTPSVGRHLSEPAVAGYETGHHRQQLYNYTEPGLDITGAISPSFKSSRDIYHRPTAAMHQHPQQQRVAAGGASRRAGSVERRAAPSRHSAAIPGRSQPSKGRPETDFYPHQHRLSRERLPPAHETEPFDERRRSHHHDLPPLPAPVAGHYMMSPPPPHEDRYAATKELPYQHHLRNANKQRHLYDGYHQPAAFELEVGDETSDDFFQPSNAADLDDDFEHRLHLHDRHQQQHEVMLLDLGPAQLDWFYELQSRGAMIVRVLFSRAANNDKELSVRRGEILEILDDSRKWWRARNIEMQVAHVPHTIVAPMHGYQTLDDLLANNPTASDLSVAGNGAGSSEDPSFMMTSSSSASMLYSRHSTNAAGAFRYF